MNFLAAYLNAKNYVFIRYYGQLIILPRPVDRVTT